MKAIIKLNNGKFDVRIESAGVEKSCDTMPEAMEFIGLYGVSETFADLGNGLPLFPVW